MQHTEPQEDYRPPQSQEPVPRETTARVYVFHVKRADCQGDAYYETLPGGFTNRETKAESRKWKAVSKLAGFPLSTFGSGITL